MYGKKIAEPLDFMAGLDPAIHLYSIALYLICTPASSAAMTGEFVS